MKEKICFQLCWWIIEKENHLRKNKKVMKMEKYILFSIIALICVVISETSAQDARPNRRKSNEDNLQRNSGSKHRINQDPNNGLSPENLRQKRPGSGQRRRTKSSHQRQDHG